MEEVRELHLYKVLLLGDSAVGKTWLFNRFLKETAGFSLEPLSSTEGEMHV